MITKFLHDCDFFSQPEVYRACLLAYYHLRVDGVTEFSTKDISSWFVDLSIPRPNESRLRKRLQDSGNVWRINKSNTFRLHATYIAKMDASYPYLQQNSDEVVEHGSILPNSLFRDIRRTHIVRLAKQINACYERNIFDGCAVLMRRLLEVLLILSYQHHSAEDAIRSSVSSYKRLDDIIADAVRNPQLKLSKNVGKCLDDFRRLGNFSAHDLYYTCRKEELDKVVLDYRVAVEELLHKAGIL